MSNFLKIDAEKVLNMAKDSELDYGGYAPNFFMLLLFLAGNADACPTCGSSDIEHYEQTGMWELYGVCNNCQNKWKITLPKAPKKGNTDE